MAAAVVAGARDPQLGAGAPPQSQQAGSLPRGQKVVLVDGSKKTSCSPSKMMGVVAMVLGISFILLGLKVALVDGDVAGGLAVASGAGVTYITYLHADYYYFSGQFTKRVLEQ